MPKDYLQTEDFDLRSLNGDLRLGESTEQHQRDLLVQDFGDDRIRPFMGVGISRYINDDAFGDIGGEIRKTFELDGMTIERLNVYDDATMDIEANYE